MEYSGQYNYRPDDLNAKQDNIIQLVAQYVAYSRDPSLYQFKVLERTVHNHNFSFMKEGDKAYNYYSFLLHTHIGRAQAGYKNERYQRDQFSDTYAQQLQQQQAAMASMHHGMVDFSDTRDVGPSDPLEAPPMKAARIETSDQTSSMSVESGTGAAVSPTARFDEEDDDDDDEAPAFKIVVDENGVQRIVKS
jgi:hypothetical protein